MLRKSISRCSVRERQWEAEVGMVEEAGSEAVEVGLVERAVEVGLVERAVERDEERAVAQKGD